MIKNISNLGDAALYCDFGTEVNKSTNSDVIKYFNTIRGKKIKGINNLTLMQDRSIVITIDDAYSSVFNYAWPILKQHNLMN